MARFDGGVVVSRRGPRPVSVRLRRLLVMLPWLQERGTVPTREMADHFGLSVDELIADLTLASLCGVSQDPRDLIDLWVDEEAVHFGIPKYFNRPLRLTAPEAFSLVASARAARELAGAERGGPLDRAVAKVAAVMGIADDERLVVEIERPAVVDDWLRAAGEGRVVDIEHWSPASGESVRREIVPVEIFTELDHWYVRAFDRGVGAERTFRLDRIESHQVTDRIEAVDLGPRRPWFADSDEVRPVVLEVDPSWMWVLEQYPGVAVEESLAPEHGRRVVVSLTVSNERWLRRLLLRLGANATVRSPQEWRSLGSATARIVRQRYDKK